MFSSVFRLLLFFFFHLAVQVEVFWFFRGFRKGLKTYRFFPEVFEKGVVNLC